MNLTTANHLMSRPQVCQRPVIAPSPNRAKKVSCDLVSHDGELAVVRSKKYKKDWEVLLIDVERR